MTSPDYSTTRRLTSEKPACFDTPVDGMQTLLKTPDSEQKIAEGGLRLKGLYKTSSEDKPLITVVTVVYNGAEFLEETIKSVIEQTYDNVEYIIVDGGSTDGTLEIIKKYGHAIDYWVSEPDKGIYDAMNKGIDLGSGEWINFMNAGDFFYASETLLKVFNSKNTFTGCHVIYGDHEVRYPNKRKIVKAGKVKNLWKGSQFCHQSAFVKLGYHKINKFNLNRKIAADFDFFAEIKSQGLDFNKAYYCISSVSSGGVSDTNREFVFREWCLTAINNKLAPRYRIIINYYVLVASLKIKNKIKNF